MDGRPRRKSRSFCADLQELTTCSSCTCLILVAHCVPRCLQTKTSEKQIQFVVWCLERTLDLMPPNVENLCLVSHSLQPLCIGVMV